MSVFLLGATGPAAASPKRITGKLSKPGYTVIALAANGKARSVRATNGSFRVRPPGATVTLQLRSPKGIYAGPIVVGRAGGGKRALLGVRAGAKLGRISVRKGYASGTPSRKWVDTSRFSRARKGIPIGARVFGRVRSRPAKNAPADDRDLDGIPDPLDVDDDGDRILDGFDRSSRASAAEISNDFGFHSLLTLYLDETANVNAAGLTPARSDAALSSRGNLLLNILPGDSPELDCGTSQSRTDRTVGGLVYCSKGGTGRYFRDDPSDWERFPDQFDRDGDGMGTLTPQGQERAPGAGNLVMWLQHGATSAQIGTGDLLIQRVVRNGLNVAFPATVSYVFATVAALITYDDGQGDSVVIPYPIPTGGPGTRENPIPVKAAPNGDVTLKLKFWRPQRRAVPEWGETGDWIDLGHLHYMVGYDESGDSCPKGSLSEHDPTLDEISVDGQEGKYDGFSDTAPDRAPDPTKTIAYTLNLTQCAEATGSSFKVGQERSFSFTAKSPTTTDSAEHGVFFKRVP